MTLTKFRYALRNWRAHARGWLLGTTTPGTDGSVVYEGELRAKVYRANGRIEDLGVVCRRCVTTAGVNYMRDCFNAHTGSADIQNFNYHDSGTGTGGEVIGDTDLGTPAGPTTRATGTPSGGTSKVYQTVGTITYSGALAITEHGVFSQAARGGGTLWDRSMFSAINVASLDSIQFTYQLTISDGG